MTLSQNQRRHIEEYWSANSKSPRHKEVRLLHTSISPEDDEIKAKGLPLTMSRVRVIKFIMDEIYPGGRLPRPRSDSSP